MIIENISTNQIEYYALFSNIKEKQQFNLTIGLENVYPNQNITRKIDPIYIRAWTEKGPVKLI